MFDIYYAERTSQFVDRYLLVLDNDIGMIIRKDIGGKNHWECHSQEQITLTYNDTIRKLGKKITLEQITHPEIKTFIESNRWLLYMNEKQLTKI
jgi:hypothetical protein